MARWQPPFLLESGFAHSLKRFPPLFFFLFLFFSSHVGDALLCSSLRTNLVLVLSCSCSCSCAPSLLCTLLRVLLCAVIQKGPCPRSLFRAVLCRSALNLYNSTTRSKAHFARAFMCFLRGLFMPCRSVFLWCWPSYRRTYSTG